MIEDLVRAIADNASVVQYHHCAHISVKNEDLLDLILNVLGEDSPEYGLWKARVDQIRADAEKEHRAAVAWDGWRDSLIVNPRSMKNA